MSPEDKLKVLDDERAELLTKADQNPDEWTDEDAARAETVIKSIKELRDSIAKRDAATAAISADQSFASFPNATDAAMRLTATGCRDRKIGTGADIRHRHQPSNTMCTQDAEDRMQPRSRTVMTAPAFRQPGLVESKIGWSDWPERAAAAIIVTLTPVAWPRSSAG